MLKHAVVGVGTAEAVLLVEGVDVENVGLDVRVFVKHASE